MQSSFLTARVILYNFLYFVYCGLYFPYLLLSGKWHQGFCMRFGRFSADLLKALDGKPHIWVHAVSMGEVVAIKGLVQELSGRYLKDKIVFSTVTQTGYAMAREHLGNVCTVIFAPLDFSWVARKYITHINPKIYIVAETEIWPNLFTALHRQRVPVVIVNGRISDKAYRGYRRARWLLAAVFHRVDRFCMQSTLDAQRVREFGAAPDKVIVTGNLKFENIAPSGDLTNSHLGFKADDRLIVAGSTHPGEEEILLDAFRRLREDVRGLRLVIVPRHVDRAHEVVRLAVQKKFTAELFSRVQPGAVGPDVVVADVVGRLIDFYGLAEVVFVGKSLTVGGGQNMIEPAVLAKPVIVGPMTGNFKDVVRIFHDAGGIVQVKDAGALFAAFKELLTDTRKAQLLGRAARKTVEKYQGAVARNMSVINQLLVR